MSVKRMAALAVMLVTAACGGMASSTSTSGRVNVVTSISTFNSMVEAIGGQYVHVQSLVPVGASPETYQPTPQDVATLAGASLLIENGAGLESWLNKTVQNAGAKNLHVVVCSDGLTVKNDNPHLWMDPVNARRYVDVMRDGLIAVDPAHAAEYRANALKYNARLMRLQDEIARKIHAIPASQRYMIVFHNAWQYYDDRFGIKTLGFIEVNPGQEPNPQQIARLIDLARAHHVRAIFSEPEYSPKLAQQIARNSDIHIVDKLYDDSIGTDPRVSTYIGLMKYDTGVIVTSLK